MDELFRQSRAIFVGDPVEKEVPDRSPSTSSPGRCLPSTTARPRKRKTCDRRRARSSAPTSRSARPACACRSSRMSEACTVEFGAPARRSGRRSCATRPASRWSTATRTAELHHAAETAGDDEVCASAGADDPTVANGFSLWIARTICAGRSLNAVQIAEALIAGASEEKDRVRWNRRRSNSFAWRRRRQPGDAPGFAACFTPDGVYHDYIYGAFTGREAIAHMLADHFTPMPATTTGALRSGEHGGETAMPAALALRLDHVPVRGARGGRSTSSRLCPKGDGLIANTGKGERGRRPCSLNPARKAPCCVWRANYFPTQAHGRRSQSALRRLISMTLEWFRRSAPVQIQMTLPGLASAAFAMRLLEAAWAVMLR